MSKAIKIDYDLPAATLTARNPTIAYLHQGRESDTGRTKTGTAAVAHWNSLQYDDAGAAATTSEVDAITENAPADGDTLKELADRLTALEGAPGGAGTPGVGIVLLSSTTVNLNEGTAAKQSLFTCPPSRHAIASGIIMHHWSGQPTAAAVSFGWNASADNLLPEYLPYFLPYFSPQVALPYVFQSQAESVGGAIAAGTPADILGLIVLSPEGSALTCIVDVFGYTTNVAGVPQNNILIP